MKKREGIVDCILEKDISPRIVWKNKDGWNKDRVPQEMCFCPVSIGSHKPSVRDDVLVEVTVSILLATFPSIAKEYHVVRLAPKDWDVIVNLYDNRKVLTFKGSAICFDEGLEKTVIDTVAHVDFAGPDGSIGGSEFGIHKEYIKGWVASCRSVELSYEIEFEDRHKTRIDVPTCFPEGAVSWTFLDFDDLMEDWRRENGLPSGRFVELDDYDSVRYEEQ